MRRVSVETAASVCVLALLIAGCGESKGDPKAEAPPQTKVEREQDVNLVQVDHPEQSFCDDLPSLLH